MRITFDEPDLVVGLVTNIVRSSNEVRFLTRSRIFTPDVPTQSGTRALINAAQPLIGEPGAEVNNMILDFNRLQSRVTLRVGLNNPDLTVDDVEARLVAYDALGNALLTHAIRLGTAARPITNLLEVVRPHGGIQRVSLGYSGLNAEVVDDLEFEPQTKAPPIVDREWPLFRWVLPVEWSLQQYPTIPVHGQIFEASGLEVTVNDLPAYVWRMDPFTYQFRLDLPVSPDPAAALVNIVARDSAGNTNSYRFHYGWRRVPARFQRGAAGFTQSGLFDDPQPWPSLLLAGKSGLLAVEFTASTERGSPATVDALRLRVDTPSGVRLFPALVLRGEQLMPYNGTRITIAPPTNFFFRVSGSALSAGSHTFTLEAIHGGPQVYTEVLATGVSFQRRVCACCCSRSIKRGARRGFVRSFRLCNTPAASSRCRTGWAASMRPTIWASSLHSCRRSVIAGTPTRPMIRASRMTRAFCSRTTGS